MLTNKLLVLFVAMWLCAAQTKVPPSDANHHFLKGKDLIDRNCTDCERGTAAGTEQGIGEVLEALKDGYSDQISAYKLLADAYANMATYVEKNDPKRSDDYWAKQRDMQRKLYALSPNDPEIAEAYSQTLQMDEQKIPVLRKAVEASPDRSALAFELGTSLMRLHKYEEGLPFVTRAVKRETSSEIVQNDLIMLTETLRLAGCPLNDEQQWEDRISSAFAKANTGTGDPTALSTVKEQFLGELNEHKCGK